jgi:glycosyltransferase involved in cell wall biosynthesis
MTWVAPDKVLITGGREVGGVTSFAQGLSVGFTEIGISPEIVRPSNLLSRMSELRSERVLKILSTTGMLLAPLARRAICVSHGVPLSREQGWLDLFGLVTLFKIANLCPAARLVTVSDYSALHLKYIFSVRIDSIIRNPLGAIFLEPFDSERYQRRYITFVGRLVECKQLHLLLPAICDLLQENPDLRCCIVGDGPYRHAWEQSVAGIDRVEFVGSRDPLFVREQLRQSKIFISGAGNESLGIVYLEALSQGCVVAMPATGGGIEIALQSIGSSIQLLPISLDRRGVLAVLRRALEIQPSPIALECYSPSSIASAYLDVDRRLAERPAPLTETVRE